MTEVNHEPGPSTTQSALRIAATDLRAGGRVGRHEAHRTDRAGGDRDLRLPADHAARHPGRRGRAR